MEFNAREDIEAPIDFVFEQVTDFPTFERSIMRRGGDVERITGGDLAELGTKWDVKFRMRGKERSVAAELVTVAKPTDLAVDVVSGNVNGSMIVELIALSRARTRLIVKAKADAKTISAKLLFKSMRFAHARTEARFADVVSNFAKDVDKRYRA